MNLTFSTLLWSSIALAELMLVALRFFLHPGPLRLTLSLLIPLLIIAGAVANAIYNRITTGHALDDPLAGAKRQ